MNCQRSLKSFLIISLSSSAILNLHFNTKVFIFAKAEEMNADYDDVLYYYHDTMYESIKNHDSSEDEAYHYDHDFDLYRNQFDNKEDNTLGDSEEEDANWFMKNNADDQPKEPKCRDDSYMECDEVLERGDCSLNETSILSTSTRKLCPVTCGVCKSTANAVWLEHDCFQHNEDIHVFFQNTDPDDYDFVGIYPESYDFEENPKLLLQALLWLTSCGGIHKYCKAAKGGLLFNNLGPSDEMSWDFFPLPPGQYKAALSTGGKPHELIIQSEPFEAKAKGHSCYFDLCQDLMYTDRHCYDYRKESIRITFENCQPQEDDLIAIYKHGETPGEEQPLLWLGTCGTKDCMGEVAYDILVFGPKEPDESGRSSWPLPPGDYSAHLMKYFPDSKHGIPVAQSDFSVSHNCNTLAS
jgi:hypothetical protein